MPKRFGKQWGLIMTDDIVTRLRQNLFHIQEGCGEFACEYLDTDLTDKDLLEAADEIERLRADRKELLQIARLFADEGMCRMYDDFGTCIHIDGVCDWHDAEHLWESFCMSRGF